MDFNKLSDLEKKKFAELMFAPLSSPEELKDWIKLFFGLEYPNTITDRESNSNPVDAIWQVYNAFRINDGQVPGIIWLSARDCLKTVSVAILEMLLMLHFRLEIAHAAATESQSHVCIRYIEGFLLKIEALISAAGWINSTANKRTFEFTTPEGNRPFIRIVIASPRGMNSLHANLLCVGAGETISIKNPDQNAQRKRIGEFASVVYDMFHNGENPIAISFNHEKGIVEEKPIVAAYESHKDLLKISLEDGTSFRVSPEHRIFVYGKGYIEAKDVLPGENVLKLSKIRNFDHKKSLSKVEYEPLITPAEEYVEQVLIGSLLGDGGCYRRPKNNAYYAEQHSQKQKEYLEWKANILETQFRVRRSLGYSGYRDAKDMAKINTGNDARLNPYSTFKKTFYNVEKLGPLGLAIWFMDDGSGGQGGLSINSQSFTKEQNEYLVKILNDKFDLNVHLNQYNKNGKVYWTIKGDAGSLYKLYKICQNYWHPTMLYKFDKILSSHLGTCRVCGDEFVRENGIQNTTKHCSNGECIAIEKKIVKTVKIKKIEKTKKWRTIDFTVKDNNNFFVKNTLVHNCVDELDLADPVALAEGKNIVGYSRGIHGFTLFLSTRKYQGGNMTQVIENRHETGYSLLRWNILDLCEKCPPSRHKPELPKESRYVAKDLPLTHISVGEWDLLPDVDKRKYDLVENAHAGCKECLLLPICKTNLTKLPDNAVGGFYKPIKAVIQKFRENSPEIASSQLLCWTPGSAGLVYPRFLNDTEKGNVITLQKAYEELTGDNLARVNELTLLNKMQELGIQFYAGVDWGFTHDAVISIVAELPNGDIWGMDCFASPGLEFADILEIAISFRDKYNPSKWFCDTAMPSHIKSFNKNGMKAPNFKKDVPGGIEALRAKIVNASGRRSFRVLQTENNKKVIHAFSKHMFILDSQGNPTDRPGDEKTIADILDSYRYIFQNKWPVKGPQKPSMSWPDQQKNHLNQSSESTEMMKNEIFKRVVEGGGEMSDAPTTGSKGGLRWNF